VRPSHLIHRCLALDGALRHRARRKVPLGRIVVPRAHTRLPVEGLPDDPVWQTRSGRAFEGAEAQVESVLRAADAVVNPVASRGEAPLAIGEGGARKAHAYLRLAVGASVKLGGDSALGICATVWGVSHVGPLAIARACISSQSLEAPMPRKKWPPPHEPLTMLKPVLYSLREGQGHVREGACSAVRFPPLALELACPD